MQVQLKSAIIIIATLIIGMVLGGLVQGTIRTQYYKSRQHQAAPDRFQMMLNRVVQPDETQKEAFDEIINQYGARFNEQKELHTAQMTALVDSMTDDLSDILSPEQIESLREKLTRFRKGGPHRGEPRRGESRRGSGSERNGDGEQ